MASLDATNAPHEGLKVKIVDVKEALTKRNPRAPAAAIESAARLVVVVVAEALMKLPKERQRALLENPSQTSAAFTQFITQLDRQLTADAKPVAEGSGRVRLQPIRREQAKGAGLGARVSRDAGRRRLADYAEALTLEGWAGPVAGPNDLEQKYGIRRSTLQDWRRSGAVIGLLKGVRKHVFPIGQFVDGRPVKGLAEIQEIVGDPRTAWLWLVEPATTEDRTPLARLRRGEVDDVLEAARDDFA